jgi:hypothetical protein
LEVDWGLHIARDTQERLELINEVIGQFTITFSPYSEWECDFVGPERRLRPVHYARFTERWDWHGRLYTGRYGHQGLRKIERRTIEFNECPGVELDYGGIHPRMLYHLEGVEYPHDPYALWGAATTGPQRLLAKKIVNAAINATGRRAAISAFNNDMRTWTTAHGERCRKQGKALENAIKLERAYRTAGGTAADIYDRMLRYHPPLAQYFGSDAGMWLMRLDSMIAMDVMYHFAKQCIPCLACHDSFIVPQPHSVELREVMLRSYYTRFGRMPVIKP